MEEKKYFLERIKTVKSRLNEENIDNLILNDNITLRYLAGIQILSDFLFVFSSSEGDDAGNSHDFLIVPMLEYQRVKDALNNFPIKVLSFSSMDEYKNTLREIKKSNKLLDSKIGLYYENMSLENYKNMYNFILAESVPNENSENDKNAKSMNGKPIFGLLDSDKIINATPIIDDLRKCKFKDEVDYLRKACEIGDFAMGEGAKALEDGISEIEIAAIIENAMRRKGAEGKAFDTIVASGVNSSYPHAGATEKIIRNGELVTIDMGAIYKGYYSDMTRTFFVGDAPYDDLYVEILKTVNEAQIEAIKALKPGVKCSDVDKAARKYLKNHKGWDKYFIHGLGHGIGLEVHDKIPRLAPKINYMLQPGMCVTVEPGVYIPGKAGARTEDSFVITEDGYEYLTKYEKQEVWN